jgi:hypothetical protein
MARFDGGAQIVEAVGGEQFPERRLVDAARRDGVKVIRDFPAGMKPLEAPRLGLDARRLPERGVVAQGALVDGLVARGRRLRAFARRRRRGALGRSAENAARRRGPRRRCGRHQRRRRDRQDQPFKHERYLIWAAMTARRCSVAG